MYFRSLRALIEEFERRRFEHRPKDGAWTTEERPKLRAGGRKAGPDFYSP
jgi:hypothetical protein